MHIKMCRILYRKNWQRHMNKTTLTWIKVTELSQLRYVHDIICIVYMWKSGTDKHAALPEGIGKGKAIGHKVKSYQVTFTMVPCHLQIRSSHSPIVHGTDLEIFAVYLGANITITYVRIRITPKSDGASPKFFQKLYKTLLSIRFMQKISKKLHHFWAESPWKRDI